MMPGGKFGSIVASAALNCWKWAISRVIKKPQAVLHVGIIRELQAAARR